MSTRESESPACWLCPAVVLLDSLKKKKLMNSNHSVFKYTAYLSKYYDRVPGKIKSTQAKMLKHLQAQHFAFLFSPGSNSSELHVYLLRDIEYVPKAQLQGQICFYTCWLNMVSFEFNNIVLSLFSLLFHFVVFSVLVLSCGMFMFKKGTMLLKSLGTVFVVLNMKCIILFNKDGLNGSKVTEMTNMFIKYVY